MRVGDRKLEWPNGAQANLEMAVYNNVAVQLCGIEKRPMLYISFHFS